MSNATNEQKLRDIIQASGFFVSADCSPEFLLGAAGDMIQTLSVQVSEVERQEFVDDAAKRMFPVSLQLHTVQVPNLDPNAPPQIKTDFGAAAMVSYHCGNALWAAREHLNKLAAQKGPNGGPDHGRLDK